MYLDLILQENELLELNEQLRARDNESGHRQDQSSEDESGVGSKHTKDHCCNWKGKTWVVYALVASMFFALCNEAIAEITAIKGPECLFYFASGSVLTGLIFNLYKCTKNFQQQGLFWNDQNIMVGGRVKCSNLFGLTIFMIQHFMVQNLVYLSMWISNKAAINVGVMSSLWLFNPLFLALTDRYIYRTKLNIRHLLGMFCLVACTLFIYFGDHNAHTLSKVHSFDGWVFPRWLAILFALLAALAFTNNGILVNYLTSHRVGFQSMTLTFTAYFIVNLVVLIAGICYWSAYSNFDAYCFWIGLGGSIINTVGIACAQVAMTEGPMAPASAIFNFNVFILLGLEILKYRVVPSTFELLGFVFGILGGMIELAPRIFSSLQIKLCPTKEQMESRAHKQKGSPKSKVRKTVHFGSMDLSSASGEVQEDLFSSSSDFEDIARPWHHSRHGRAQTMKTERSRGFF